MWRGAEHRRGTCTVGSRGEESRGALELQKGVRAPALESEWAWGPEFSLTTWGRFCGGHAARRAERDGSACRLHATCRRGWHAQGPSRVLPSEGTSPASRSSKVRQTEV